jgi:hypothetical protein
MIFKLSNGKFLTNTEVVIFEKQIVTTRQRVQKKIHSSFLYASSVHENIKQISKSM